MQIAIMSLLTNEAQQDARKLNPRYSDVTWRDTLKYNTLNYNFSLDLLANLYTATKT